MERLTKRIDGYAHGAEGISSDKLTGAYCRGQFGATACVEKLAEYENLEGQGLLLKLPVAIGDTVYITDGSSLTVREIHIQDNLVKYFVARFNPNGLDVRFTFDTIGKTVFLTQVEAEEELKRMENKN